MCRKQLAESPGKGGRGKRGERQVHSSSEEGCIYACREWDGGDCGAHNPLLANSKSCDLCVSACLMGFIFICYCVSMMGEGESLLEDSWECSTTLAQRSLQEGINSP